MDTRFHHQRQAKSKVSLKIRVSIKGVKAELHEWLRVMHTLLRTFSRKAYLKVPIQNGLCCPLWSDKLIGSFLRPVTVEGEEVHCFTDHAIFYCLVGCRWLLRELLSLAFGNKCPAQASTDQPRQMASSGVTLLKCCTAVLRTGRT